MLLCGFATFQLCSCSNTLTRKARGVAESPFRVQLLVGRVKRSVPKSQERQRPWKEHREDAGESGLK